jgi:hypothetical protein
MSMSINGISSYITQSTLYGQDINSTDQSDPLLMPDVSGTTQSSIFATLGGSNSSLSDSVDLSQTADFFSKLQQLEQTDPNKFKEVLTKLAEKLQSAHGFEEQVFSDLAQSVANGADITQLLTQSSSSTDLYTPTGTNAGKNDIKQLITNVLEKLNNNA